VFRTLNEYLYYISGFLYYLSATVNPVLYNLVSGHRPDPETG
jgi:hypothetical protein